MINCIAVCCIKQTESFREIVFPFKGSVFCADYSGDCRIHHCGNLRQLLRKLLCRALCCAPCFADLHYCEFTFNYTAVYLRIKRLYGTIL